MVFVWHVRLSNELQRRIRRDTTGRLDSHLERAIEQLASVLPSASAKNSAPSPETSAILEGKRKAIKAALKAGVKPPQVARYFGVSLAEVRKVASQAD
jgi:predicted transcriptional regulator